MKKFSAPIISVAAAGTNPQGGAMKTMLDDMAVYFDVNNGKFDQVFYDKL